MSDAERDIGVIEEEEAAPPSPPPTAPAAGAASFPRRGAEHKYLIAFAVVLAALMQVIDSSIVNVALPDMMGTLGANLDEIAWVSTGYILASVIIIPLTGWLGNFFGRKRYFVGSIIIFTASSFLCGAAHSLTSLVIWRIIQGLGGGALMTVSQAVLFESFPPEEAGTAMALFGLGVMVGPTIGPTLGGWLVDNYGWPWIFYINIPVGIVAAVMIAAYVHDPEGQRKPASIDYQGIALLAVSVGAIQYVLEHGQREDWFDSRFITTLVVIGVVGMVALLWRELTTDHPVIDFRVMRHRQMWVGTILGVVMGVGLYAMSFTLPVFLQQNLRMTAEQTGLTLLPGALATAVSMAVVGRLTNKFDPRLLIASGALIFAYAAWQLAHITGESGQSDFFWPLIWRGVGLGLMFVPVTTITLAELSVQELGQGTGLYNFFRQLGGSFGIAVIATLVARYTSQFRAIIGEHLGVTDPMSLSRLNMLTRGMIAKGADPQRAHEQALRLLEGQLMGQASVIAYSRIYMLAMILILCLIPLLLLVRTTKGAAGAHAVME
ncbi:MAG: DHA2 family efflux MFS transporter permease subunit [Gemmatimonadaceae bacterium]|nr:DHA2 family efflux MFS transporter permease subunit [Gemmatimonadaceae bacterium]NUQ94468.1 DHA2 family efflux MFS transporter permease subunit [Gemmatimonadaceae bacterium]NUR32440.1 DHA2 family efflux MFS transporter permease subunit [Gemmatimonadaceae bacterium]NUS97865.1 DHA2 family efflux MFS transporter permease subunit [Gemmatimonadaceae bacterium]